MIPELGRFPASWLTDAELSLTVGRPERVGLSFFSADTTAFYAFGEQIGLPAAARADEERLRACFDLAPRHWVKLRYLAGERVGCSQYFAIHQRNVYPVTTLRLFARQFGVRDVTRIEALLAPALERDDTSWIVSLKREQLAAEPRFSCRLPRTVVPRLLETAVEEGYLERERAEQYLAWNRNLEAGDAAHVTFDPLRQELGGLDYENPAPDSLPAGWQQATTGFAAGPPRYLKCRLASGATRPEWVIYLNAR